MIALLSRAASRSVGTTCACVGIATGLCFAIGPRALTGLDARPVVAASEARDADTVKSVFLYTVAARHVEWPESVYRDKTSPFVIGVLGSDPIVAALVETCRDRKKGDRQIEVRTVLELDAAAKCQILFVPANREKDLPAVAEVCKGRPTLLVGSSEESVRKGAHIGAFLEKSKLRFAADPSSAKRCGLEIGSELLKLARLVDKRAGGPP